MTPSAGLVAQGRDNTGAAAILNSQQDETFIDRMVGNIAQEKLRLERKKEEDQKALRDTIGELEFDPLGIEELDNENEQLVVAAEDYAVEQYKAGKDPMDVTTEEGKEFLRLQREAKRNAALGKEADAQFRLAIQAANKDGVDKLDAAKWLQGYKDAKPVEGETVGQAKSNYIKNNPYRPKKMVGMYDFVTPLMENISYGQKGRMQSIDEAAVKALLNKRLLDPEGGEVAKSQMAANGLDYSNPEDVKKYVDSQYDLIKMQFPDKRQPSPSSGSGSSSDTVNTATSGKGSGSTKYAVKYTDNPYAYKGGGDNAIQLDGFTSEQINLPDGRVVTGVPKAILKDSNGKLVLEFSEKLGENKYQKSFIPYDMYRSQIEIVFGKDISQYIGGGDGSPYPGDGKMTTQGGDSPAPSQSAPSNAGEWEEVVIGGVKVRRRKKQ
jgi:hypothetical protein